jgi:hypothetical protein
MLVEELTFIVMPATKAIPARLAIRSRYYRRTNVKLSATTALRVARWILDMFGEEGAR